MSSHIRWTRVSASTNEAQTLCISCLKCCARKTRAGNRIREKKLKLLAERGGFHPTAIDRCSRLHRFVLLHKKQDLFFIPASRRLSEYFGNSKSTPNGSTS